MKIFILIGFVILFLGTCKTSNRNVEKLVHQKIISPMNIKNIYKNSFINNIQGNYIMSDNSTFTIDSSGYFELGITKFSLHEVLNNNQAIYVASTDIIDNNKKVYTYHGINITDTSINLIPYKFPTYKNRQQLTPKDTEYSWEVNLFQPENINWKSSFLTKLADKVK